MNRPRPRKPPKRVDPLVELKDIRISTTQWLRLMDMAASIHCTEEQLVRMAIGLMVKSVEPR